MLQGLSIRDVVLIDALDIEAQAGLCALTGETGAGKSIVLDALGLALGARADTGLIRSGAEQSVVSAQFQVLPAHPVCATLDAQGLQSDEVGRIVLRRIVGRDGRSRAFINDQPVGVSLLRDVGAMLVDIHGQFETHGLMDAKTHRATLDTFAGLEAASRKVAEAYSTWRIADAALEDMKARIETARRDEAYLQDSLAELEKLNPQTDEETQLLERRQHLQATAHITQAFTEARDWLEGADGALHALNRAYRVLERVQNKAGDKLNPALEAIDRAIGDVRSVADICDGWFDHDMGGPDTLEALDDRLHALRAAARKHQVTCTELPGLRVTIAEKLGHLRDDDTQLAALSAQAVQARADYAHHAEALSAARQKAAKKLDRAIMAELPPLKLEKARFETQITRLPDTQWGAAGLDQVQFVVATNHGTEAGPMDKIASGGELSRFMLAIKLVLATAQPATVMVFDEVDSGLGGATADAVGERLALLAQAGKQVFVVTHAPQVAARAAHHWIIAKSTQAGKTRTTLTPLEGAAARKTEIARMLAGATVTDEALAAAGKLLQLAS